MLDLKFIRENPEIVKEGIRFKNEKGIIDRLLELDQQRRMIIFRVEQIKKERNKISKDVANLIREKKDAADLIEKSKDISTEIKNLDQQRIGIY